MIKARQGSLRQAAVLANFLALAAAGGLLGCAALPSAGPQRSDIAEQEQPRDAASFRLIDLSREALAAEARRPQPGFAERFGSAAPAPLRVDVGDRLSVEIWEAGSTTLFSRAPISASGVEASPSARNVTLADQSVDLDGTVTLPFAGRVAVLGLDQQGVEQALTQALAGKAARPQVIVHIRSESKAVTVIGDVSAGARVPLTARGERLLDVLAAVGGVRVPSYEARLQLTRNGESHDLPLLRVLQDPRQNIVMQPGDLLVATRQPQSFTAFGATGRNAQIEFGAEQVSLIEAVAKTGGLLDNRADPRGVYLLRYEPRALLESAQAVPAADPADEVRVIYRLDMSQADSYFLAQRFTMRDRDILYVSSAPANQLQKFLELIGLVTQPVIQGAVIRGALK